MVDRLRIAGSAVLVGALALAGCASSPGAASTPAVTSPVAAAPPTTVAAATTLAPSTTSALPTSTSTSTTTSTTTSTSTSNTTPALDRGDEATVDRMRADLAVLLAMGPRVSGSAAEAAAARHLADQATAITGVGSVMQKVPLPDGGASVNAWAAAVGSGDRVLLLGAHLDSVAESPGADDNGSGVVLLLELLRRLAEDPPPSLRVIVVGFGAEERIPGFGHHYGSGVAAERLVRAGDLPDLMLSVDMVGVGVQLYSVDFTGSTPTFADQIPAGVAATGIEVRRLSRGEISDHVAFARVGVPSAHLWRPDNPAWHTPEDGSVSEAALLDTLRVLEALVEWTGAG